MTKPTKDSRKNEDYCAGSAAAFGEAADKVRELASHCYLNRKDEAADVLRDLVGYFLTQAQKCHVEEEP